MFGQPTLFRTRDETSRHPTKGTVPKPSIDTGRRNGDHSQCISPTIMEQSIQLGAAYPDRVLSRVAWPADHPKTLGGWN